MTLLSATLLSLAPAGRAEEKPPPPNEPPHLWRASASRQDGKVVIQIARPEYVAPRKSVAAEAMKWDHLRPVVLGPAAQAVGADGKALGPEAVLKALAEPKGVVVFVRFHRTVAGGLLAPDPSYLALLREGTVVLVVAAADIGPLVPAP